MRPEHAANEGSIFAWDDPPPTGNPGDAPDCRCEAEPYEDNHSIEPVYPELIIIPTLRIGGEILVAALRIVRSIFANRKAKNRDLFTDHGGIRSSQRSISADEIDQAIKLLLRLVVYLLELVNMEPHKQNITVQMGS